MSKARILSDLLIQAVYVWLSAHLTHRIDLAKQQRVVNDASSSEELAIALDYFSESACLAQEVLKVGICLIEHD